MLTCRDLRAEVGTHPSFRFGSQATRARSLLRTPPRGGSVWWLLALVVVDRVRCVEDRSQSTSV